MMKIAFMHYHLKTGGVTTCLRQQAQAIQNDCETLMITGELPETPFPADTVAIPELAYSTISQKSFDPADVADAIFRTINLKFNGSCDVLHVHNPILAKNNKFLKILKMLQKRSLTLFLQIHDFAEDGRPLAYFSEEYLDNCHYGVVNLRDYHILLKAGLKKDGLHYFFNTVNRFPSKSKAANGSSCVLYPIRAIRRKNIGEAILLSLFFSNGESLAITLPPNSPVDFESYKGWKAFAADQRLNVEFDRGLKDEFEALVQSARYLVTTSITEGFGFSFLEPWLFEKLIWGRKLPDICSDFEANNIRLNHLYTELVVPIDWIGHQKFYERWTASVQKICSFFNFPVDKEHIKRSFEAITGNGTIDFGLLDESFQKQVILRLLSSKKNAENLLQLNSFLSGPGDVPHEKDLITNNRTAVLKNYNMSLYRQKLMEIYKKVTQNTVNHCIDKNILLAAFLDLKRFSLLKWGDYRG